MSSSTSIPVIPTALGVGLRPLPLGPLALAIDLITRSVARGHDGMFGRLGEHAKKVFLIDPTDLPFVFVLRPEKDNPSVSVARSGEGLAVDARIAGPIAALIGLVHGAYDGDALFFSRDLVIEGDVEAVLALRNALDDAELDLVVEAAAAMGPLASPAQQLGRVAASWLEWMTGVAMTRPRAKAT
jgi:O2-independent ubiquinone biosynthesis accessory factor UbiT